jgi:hypothetical protein
MSCNFFGRITEEVTYRLDLKYLSTMYWDNVKQLNINRCGEVPK